jgi:hypothetical protein
VASGVRAAIEGVSCDAASVGAAADIAAGAGISTHPVAASAAIARATAAAIDRLDFQPMEDWEVA